MKIIPTLLLLPMLVGCERPKKPGAVSVQVGNPKDYQIFKVQDDDVVCYYSLTPVSGFSCVSKTRMP
jgi:hypothetical protein